MTEPSSCCTTLPANDVWFPCRARKIDRSDHQVHPTYSETQCGENPRWRSQTSCRTVQHRTWLTQQARDCSPSNTGPVCLAPPQPPFQVSSSEQNPLVPAISSLQRTAKSSSASRAANRTTVNGHTRRNRSLLPGKLHAPPSDMHSYPCCIPAKHVPTSGLTFGPHSHMQRNRDGSSALKLGLGKFHSESLFPRHI